MSNRVVGSIVGLIGVLVFSSPAFSWPVPDTGQTKCYNNSGEISCPSPGEPFYGQDANYTINPPSYKSLGGGSMVRDNVTGLIWEAKTDDGTIHDRANTYTWYDGNPDTNGDGTVTDTWTGLMWQQAGSATGMPWSDALSDSESMTLGGLHRLAVAIDKRASSLPLRIAAGLIRQSMTRFFRDIYRIGIGHPLLAPITRATRGAWISTTAATANTIRHTAGMFGRCEAGSPLHLVI